MGHIPDAQCVCSGVEFRRLMGLVVFKGQMALLKRGFRVNRVQPFCSFLQLSGCRIEARVVGLLKGL